MGNNVIKCTNLNECYYLAAAYTVVHNHFRIDLKLDQQRIVPHPKADHQSPTNPQA